MRKDGIVARGASRLPQIAAIGLAAVVITSAGWISDDAYITFRTVDNLVHGLGPVWNAAERVQAYTHPLWMLLLAAGRLLTGEIFFTAIGAGLVCSLLALALLAAGARTAAAGALAVLVLVFSRAFVDYSTSGLENPLSHLLLAGIALLLASDGRSQKRLFLLSLLASLCVLTRPDLALLVAPGLLVATRSVPCRRAAVQLAAGAAPLVAWEAFSVVYYGFPFPNTAYAKLGTGIAHAALREQGVRYLADSWSRDPITLAAVAAAVAVAAARGDRWARSIASGILLYLLYVVSIGGDFMSGRFLSAPVLLAVAVLSRRTPTRPWQPWAAAGALVALSLSAPRVPLFEGASYCDDREAVCDPSGICDERRFYCRASGLIRYAGSDGRLAHPNADKGRAYRALDHDLTVTAHAVGFVGYFAGPKVRIIDELGLADPLLARMPAVWSPQWRIGHFRRVVPGGYAESVPGAGSRLLDHDLGRFNDELERITRGPLFDRQRWESILKINLGRLDHLIDRDRYRFPGLARLTLEEAAAPEPATIPPESPDLTGLPTLGVRVDLGVIRHAPTVSLTLRGTGEHLFVYLNGDDVVAHRRADAAAAGSDAAPGRLTLPAPASAVSRGYDRLMIVPVRKSTPLGVSGLKLG